MNKTKKWLREYTQIILIADLHFIYDILKLENQKSCILEALPCVS